MNPPNIERNKMVVLAVNSGQKITAVAKSLKMAKSTICHIYHRDKHKYSGKVKRFVRSYPQTKT